MGNLEKLGLLVVVIMVVVIGVVLITPDDPKQPTALNTPTGAEPVENDYGRDLRKFFIQHPTDDYWLWQMPSDKDMMDTRVREPLIRNLNDNAEFVRQTLVQYRNVDPLAAEIADTFTHPFASILMPNGGTVSLSDDKKGFEHLGKSGVLEICFMPAGQVTETLPSALFYKADYKAVVMAAIRWPQPVAAGAIMHECGHALRHRQGAASSTAPTTSDLYVQEEIEMHELETKVLDAATNGDYSRWIDKVLDRAKDAKSASEAIRVIRFYDWEALAGLLGSTRDGKRVANAVISQALMATGLRLIDQRHAGSLAEKIAFYRRVNNGEDLR